MKFEKGSWTTLLYHCDPLGVLGIGRLVESDIARYDILRKIGLTSLNLTGSFPSSSRRVGNVIANRLYRVPSSSSPSDRLNASSPSLVKSFTSYVLPQSLTDSVEEKIQRNKDNKREWVIGVLLCAVAATIVMVINIILTIIAVAVAYSRTEDQGFVSATLYEGKCYTPKNWARGLHLLINILSTIMLAASNYCMQCLSSPSRQNIDDLHPQQEWLDIGIPSLKNLFFIGWKRRVLWMVLLVSSLPIHLMFVSESIFSLLFGSNRRNQIQFCCFLCVGY